jgi:Predicted Zn-dependent hydrolases of the beta-lactamase fold
MIQTPKNNIYISGDTGYDIHFKAIAKQFPKINLAIIENGQYNEQWSHIHLMPEDLLKACKELNANKTITVHHSKYALSKHPYNEPLKNNEMLKKNGIQLIEPQIGVAVSY